MLNPELAAVPAASHAVAAASDAVTAAKAWAHPRTILQPPARCEDGAGRGVGINGGVGGASFLRGLVAIARGATGSHPLPDESELHITALTNTADDITLHGLRICPDLDTVMYTLGDGIDDERGWGRFDESFTVQHELLAYGAGPAWFGMGDRDLATHLIRSHMLDAGYPLTDVTAALCERWQPGVDLLPMSDDRVETHVITDHDGQRTAMHFQQWWLEHRAELPVHEFAFVGIDAATPTSAVQVALERADAVLLAPSNPVVSTAPVLAVPGIRDLVRQRPVIGVSPIIGGAPVRGYADACLRAIGVDSTAAAVARHYGPRRDGGLLDGWLVDTVDAASCEELASSGIEVRSLPLLMTTPHDATAIAQSALELATELAGGHR